MEKYRIKINNEFYVRAILISGQEPHISVLPTYDKDSAGWYLEDNAKGYVEMFKEEYKNIPVEIEKVDNE